MAWKITTGRVFTLNSCGHCSSGKLLQIVLCLDRNNTGLCEWSFSSSVCLSPPKINGGLSGDNHCYSTCLCASTDKRRDAIFLLLELTRRIILSIYLHAKNQPTYLLSNTTETNSNIALEGHEVTASTVQFVV